MVAYADINNAYIYFQVPWNQETAKQCLCLHFAPSYWESTTSVSFVELGVQSSFFEWVANLQRLGRELETW